MKNPSPTESTVNLSHLNAACKRVGLKMLKGNRDKRKINTPDGLITTSGKKFVWHLYVIPMMGPTLGKITESPILYTYWPPHRTPRSSLTHWAGGAF